jgi:8-oxo-dGTP pyrophosphatase MutT (NUDIX family)
MSKPIHMLRKLEQLPDAFQGKRATVERHVVVNNYGDKATWEVVRVKNAVAILPFVDADNIILLHNYRYPVGLHMMEVPAGLIDGEESPRDAALRELMEETSRKAGRLDWAGTFYPSPGLITEKITCFCAYDLTEVPPPAEQEMAEKGLEPTVTPLKEAYEWVMEGQMTDLKTAHLVLRAWHDRSKRNA